jgi:serine/threonine protein kinase
MHLTEHSLFSNRYKLIRLLGRGGFSEVWLVDDQKTGLQMALKIYAPGTGLDESGIETFTQEFSLVFNLNHSNLLKPTYFDEQDRMPYLILPYCKNGSAARLVGKMDEGTAWRFLEDVTSGLAFLHRQEPPLIHQDIKPDNILMDDNFNFQITDFGISAKVRSTLRKSVVHKNLSSGTQAYMGPERFGRSPKPIKASDIWALGVTIYELLDGDMPFGEEGGLLLKSGAEIPDLEGPWSYDLKTVVRLCLLPETWDRPVAERIHQWTEDHKAGRPIDFTGFKTGDAPVATPPPVTPPSSPILPSFEQYPLYEKEKVQTSHAKPASKSKWAIGIAALAVVALIIIYVSTDLFKGASPGVPVIETKVENAEFKQ